eukprot:m.214448 g.214448  ORF g.214448 m.214448 type:complete len:52 (+) comp15530_c0_seq10:1506-1661(+)
MVVFFLNETPYKESATTQRFKIMQSLYLSSVLFKCEDPKSDISGFRKSHSE